MIKNRILMSSYKKQQGFSILAVILITVGIIVAIGAWSLSGQSNISNTNNINIQASSIASDTNSIKLVYDALLYKGANVSDITFKPNIASTVVNPNILDPSNGITMPKVSSDVIRLGATIPEGMWVYNPTGFYGKKVGTTAADPVMLLAGVKDSVCFELNKSLYGIYGAPGVAAFDSASFVSGATETNPITTTSLNINTNYGLDASGWLIGCITTMENPDNNIIFRVLKAM